MTTTGGVTITVGGGAPPPPAGGAPPARALTLMGKPVPCNPHKLFAIGTFGLGLGTAVISFIALIGLFVSFQLLAFVVTIYLVLVGLLLALSALRPSSFIATCERRSRTPLPGPPSYSLAAVERGARAQTSASCDSPSAPAPS